MSRFYRSLLSQLVLLVVIFTLTFVMIRTLPGDPARAIAGDKATPETIQQIRDRLGIGKPLPVQYLQEAKKIFVDFDLGVSAITNQRISQDLADKIPATFELSSVAMLIALLFGVPLGMLAAKNRGKYVDVILTQISLLGVSVPVFLLGLLLILFCEDYKYFGIGGRLSAGFDSGDASFYLWGSLFSGNWAMFQEALRHILLPAIALATIPMSIIMRLTRSAFLEVLGEDYLRTARAKGLGEFKIYFKHIMRVASTTLVTVVALQVGMLMSGAVLTESIFSWPGLGTYMIESIEARVYPAVQACILLFAVIFIVIHLLVDVLYVFLDPRVRGRN